MSAGTVPGMLVWIASSPAGACTAHLIDDERAPIAALRDVARVAEALHQDVPGRAMRFGPQPGVVGLPEKP